MELFLINYLIMFFYILVFKLIFNNKLVTLLFGDSYDVSQITSELEGCKRIQKFNKYSEIIEDYFVAKDKTVTQASELDNIQWE